LLNTGFSSIGNSKSDFRVGNKKDHVPPTGGTHVGVVSNLSWPVLFVNQNGNTLLLI